MDSNAAQRLVETWLDGRASVSPSTGELTLAHGKSPGLIEKLRGAYDWIRNKAILTPYTDMHFGPPLKIGRGEQRIELGAGESYASFLLLPLLTLMTSRRMVFTGAAGRGKTTVATLMGLIAGHDLNTLRRSVQHGHPQLTIADLLGSPLPSELVRAQKAEDITVSWRGWLKLRVKVIDEYNRIPTKTQSALLSLMAEGYAEMYEQIIESGRSAWYLTANDDLGGGTFPVIEALKDRIDVVVRCTPLHAEHLGALAERIESAQTAESLIPQDIVLTEDELTQIDLEVRAVPISEMVLEPLGFMLAQLDFCKRASDRLELMNKDTLHLAGRRVGHVCNEDCALDKNENLCTQTESGVSARVYQSLIHYAKALAYFRGRKAVSLEDVIELMPWVLHDKLSPNPQSAFFLREEHKKLLTDRASWIRQLFDRAQAQLAAYEPAHRPVRELKRRLHGSNTPAELERYRRSIEQAMEKLLDKHELNGPVHQDLILLKDLHARCRSMIEKSKR